MGKIARLELAVTLDLSAATLTRIFSVISSEKGDDDRSGIHSLFDAVYDGGDGRGTGRRASAAEKQSRTRRRQHWRRGGRGRGGRGGGRGRRGRRGRGRRRKDERDEK